MTGSTSSTTVVVDQPDVPSGSVVFKLMGLGVNAALEVFPSVDTYVFNLSANGEDSDTLPTPDATGDASWTWHVTKYTGQDGEGNATFLGEIVLGYSASPQELGTLLSSAATAVAPGYVGILAAVSTWLTSLMTAVQAFTSGNLVSNDGDTLTDSGVAVGDVVTALGDAGTVGQVWTADGADGAGWQDAAGGVTDHGALTGLADDDHTQYAQKANNLSDLTNAGTARTNLGLVAAGAGDIWVEKGGDTMTGVLLLPNGSQGAPALAPAADPDTGIFFGVGSMSFSVGGVYRLIVGGAGWSYQLPIHINSGGLGVGASASGGPAGGIKQHDGTGGALRIAYASVGATPQVILANGAGDVLYVLSGTYTLRDSAGNVTGGVITATAPSGTFNLFDDGGTNTFQLQVAADGGVTVVRTAGSRTYTVNLDINWL